MESAKPRKQRFFRFNAPMHARQHFVHVHVDKSLRTKLNLKKKNVQVSRGDTVKIMSGSKKGTTGKVTQVSLRSGKIFLDTVSRKNAKGKEYFVPISASNVYITALNLTDKVRAAKLKLKVEPVAQVKETKPAPKETKTEAKEQTKEQKNVQEVKNITKV